MDSALPLGKLELFVGRYKLDLEIRQGPGLTTGHGL